MDDIIKFPAHHEAGSADLRAAVLAHVLHHVAMVQGPVTYDAVVHSTMEAMDMPDEECRSEVTAATLLLAKTGLVICNTYRDGRLTINAESVLTATPEIASWVWRHDPDFDLQFRDR